MTNKTNWTAFEQVLKQHNITKLYHFTDRENLESIINNGGLHSWNDCDQKGININKPGGSSTSRQLDMRDGLQSYVRVSFTQQHPMMYVAMNDGRITNPVILEIDPAVIYWQDTKYANMNATKNGASVGNTFKDFENIHFQAVKARKHFDLPDDEQKYYQAEILVKNAIPLQYITNISSFGIPMPSQPQQLQSKESYTAQITRNTPTAFLFMIDHSGSMSSRTTFEGEQMPMSEAVARIVNHQIKELVNRCIKGDDTRHYYDIGVIGYGRDVYSAWCGNLEGRDFVSPLDIKENPYKKITVKEEKRTRRGVEIKEVEKEQWFEARDDGDWTYMHAAFEKAKDMMSKWIEQHKGKDCYPPTIINITDGGYNDAKKEEMLQVTNELKAMHTNDGNVILINIHISSGNAEKVIFPTDKTELEDNTYAHTLAEMSSLLPLRYNEPISMMRNGSDAKVRHYAMGVNADMSTLLQLMDVGTPTNINQNK